MFKFKQSFVKSRSKTDWTGIIMLVAFLVMFIASVYGWIDNIIILLHNHASMDMVIGILRILGIFVVPLGVILGYVH